MEDFIFNKNHIIRTTEIYDETHMKLSGKIGKKIQELMDDGSIIINVSVTFINNFKFGAIIIYDDINKKEFESGKKLNDLKEKNKKIFNSNFLTE